MDPKYLLGIPEIDSQHTEISDLITALRHVIEDKDQRHLVHPTLKRLHQLLATHFKQEEAFMGMVNYADLHHHQMGHKAVLKLFDNYFDHPPEVADYEYLGKLLSDKVLGHVMEHDTQLIESMKRYLGTLSTPPLNSPRKKKGSK